MENERAAFVVSLAVAALTACGSPKATMTCDQPSTSDGNVTVDRCTELKYPPAQANAIMNDCRQTGGTVSFESCRRTGALGRCDIPEDKGVSSSVYLFPDDLVQSPSGAKAACGAMGGAFSAVIETAPDDGSPARTSGNDPSLCVPPSKARSTAQFPYYGMNPLASQLELSTPTAFAVAFTSGAINIVWLGSGHCLTGIVYPEAGYSGTNTSAGKETVQASTSTIRFASAPGNGESQGVSIGTSGMVDLELFVDGAPAVEVYLYDGATASLPVSSPLAVIEN